MKINLIKYTISHIKLIAILLLLSIFIYNGIEAQTNSSQNYTVVQADTTNLAAQLKLIEAQYKKETNELSGNYKKYYVNIYKEKFDNIKKMFETNEIDNNAADNTYFQNIYNKIIKANTQLESLPIKGFISKISIPNAHSVGFNVFIVNAGLIERLTNESDVAFVIAHELAHIYLRHGENSIEKYITTLYSDEIQKELRNIKKQEFNKRQALEKLAKGFSFNNRRHSRDHEVEADSLALVFIKNTVYQPKASINTLSILDTIDQINFYTETCLSSLFNCPEYPFKNKWLAKEDGLLGGHAVLDKDVAVEDSLKTHPDCKTRIKIVSGNLKSIDWSGKLSNPIDSNQFRVLQKTLPLQTLKYYYNNEVFGDGLFLALRLLKEDPNNLTAVLSTGSFMSNILLHEKKHQLGKVLEMPSPDNNKDYNTLLQFIYNLSSDELASINYYFLKKYQAQLSAEKDFQTALSISKNNL